MKNLELLLKSNVRAELARRNFSDFVSYTKDDYQFNWHHKAICSKLQQFAKGEICKLMIFVPPQHGKLLPSDTPVFTPKGWVNHGDLKPGDYVFGQDGKPKKVIANSGAYDWPVQELTFQSGYKILAAKEHLWRLNIEYDDHKGRRNVIMDTQSIFKHRHRRSPSIDIAPALSLPEKDLPVDPYILGCWLGDGHKDLGVLTVGVQDIAHLSALGESREVKKDIYRVLIPGLTKKLRAIGVYKNKHIPIDYLTSSIEQRTSLLQGLMDTDGCVDTRGNCEFTQKSGALANDVYVLIRSLGFKARKYTLPMTLNGRVVGEKIRICFNPDSTDKVFRLPRKAGRLQNKSMGDRNDKKKFFLQSIEDYGLVKGNCIQVEGGMYLAGLDMIPTHNSQLCTRHFPAYMLGIKPKTKICVCSYSATLAESFNRDIQRIIDDIPYHDVFPETVLNESNVTTDAHGAYLRNSEIFETVGFRGFVKTVGVGGSLTGTPIDVGIIDDPFKDREEAMSTRIRDKVWSWYTDVFRTRLHNESQELIIMTRWDQDDLAGRILKRENDWEVVTFQAIKERDIPGDPRNIGEVLWPEKHSLERILSIKQSSPITFESLYQQEPKPSREALVFPDWNEYEEEPDAEPLIGLDFGFSNDPTAICQVKIEKDRMYLRELLYETGLTNTPLAQKMIFLNLKRRRIVADSAEAKTIEEFKKERGFNIIPCIKGPGSVNAGINWMKDFKLFVHKDSHNLKMELINYQYVMVGGESTNEPIDSWNHLIDAARYTKALHKKNSGLNMSFHR